MNRFGLLRIVLSRHIFAIGLVLTLAGVGLVVGSLALPRIQSYQNETILDPAGIHVARVPVFTLSPIADSINLLGIFMILGGLGTMAYQKLRDPIRRIGRFLEMSD